MIGKYGGFNPPRYPFRVRALAIGLGAAAWFWYFALAKETGAYHMVSPYMFRFIKCAIHFSI